MGPSICAGKVFLKNPRNFFRRYANAVILHHQKNCFFALLRIDTDSGIFFAPVFQAVLQDLVQDKGNPLPVGANIVRTVDFRLHAILDKIILIARNHFRRHVCQIGFLYDIVLVNLIRTRIVQCPFHQILNLSIFLDNAARNVVFMIFAKEGNAGNRRLDFVYPALNVCAVVVFLRLGCMYFFDDRTIGLAN